MNCANWSGVPATADDDQTEPRSTDDRAPSRRGRAGDVEERRGLRAEQAQHVETPVDHQRSAPAVVAQTPCSRRYADFEGEHPLKPWPSDAADRPQYQAMPPRSYQLKPWPHEAQRRGWCPFSAPQSRLRLGTGAHAQHRLCSRLIDCTGDYLQPRCDADRTRIAQLQRVGDKLQKGVPIWDMPDADWEFVLFENPEINAFAKIGVRNRIEALRYAVRHGLGRGFTA